MEGAPFFHPALLIGPIISGTIITSILFGCAIIQAYAYFTMFTEDCRGFKILVFFITSLLFAHLVCVGSLLWQMTIVEYGTPQDLIVFPHIANVVVVLGCIITFFVQAFYIYRLARLSGSWFLPSLCSTLAALSSVFGLLVAAEAFRSTSVATVERDERWEINASLIMAPIADVAITASLVYQISGKFSKSSSTRTARVLKKSVLWAVETGLVTSLCAFLVLNFVGVSFRS